MRIDFHAHILPEIDHGSSSLESSEKQLDAAKAVGINLIVATPHFYPDQIKLDTFLRKRDEAYKKILPICAKKQIELKLGAEVALCEGLENLENIEELCIEGSNVMLLELPFREVSSRLLNTIYEIQEKGIMPILAHINRYSRMNIIRALDLGVAAQLNAEALVKFRMRRRFVYCVDDGIVQTLGSDAHEDRENAYAEFDKALKFLGKKREDILMKRTAELLNID